MKTKKMIKSELFLTLVLVKLRAKEITIEIPFYPQRVNLWRKKNKDNIIFGIIITINLTTKTLIDTVLTPYIMDRYDFLVSFIATNIIYGLMGIFCLFWYDTLKKDWLLIEALKKYQLEGGHLDHKNKLIRFILKKNNLGEFVINGLIFFKNPAFFVIKKRDGIALYNGFAGKDTVILYLVYLLIMNLYWNLVVYFSISFWEPIWNFIKFILFLNFKINI